MKNKILMAFGFLMVTSVPIQSFAKINYLCEKKRDNVIASQCGKPSSDKYSGCVTKVKNFDCNTVALHESFDEQ